MVYPYDSQMELKYDMKEIEALKEDQTQLVQREAMKIASGIASPNEVRPEFGLSSDVPQGRYTVYQWKSDPSLAM